MLQPPPKPKYETIPLFQSDAKVYARAVSGVFARWRWFFVWLTQAVFYGLCWIPWHGRQAVLFDLEARRFYLFDLVLWPQDTIYLAVLLVVSALALFLFTAVAGRLWCGYSCPQTVYTEIFMWIEKVIEGDRKQRMKVDAAGWSAGKLAVKVAKHGAWLAVSLWTGFTFVGYFTPVRELAGEFAALAPSGGELFWVLFYGFATYGNAGFLREQMCKYICPYARFQFVMFDPDTLIIAYDEGRGEPRGARGKKVETSLGDCVDCGLCVQVCPTGIDIRDGLQSECIGCAACIDACDQVMDKVGAPHGLIRYSTENAVRKHSGRGEIVRRAFRPRTLIYAAVLLVVSGGMIWSLATRLPTRVDVLRDRAALAREVGDGLIENTYQLMIINASEKTHTYRIGVNGLDGIHLDKDIQVTVPAAETGRITAEVDAPEGAAPHGAHDIRFVVADVDDAKDLVQEKSKFWMP